MPGNSSSGKRDAPVIVLLCLFVPVVLIAPFLIIFPHAFRDAQAQNRVASAYLSVDATILSSEVKTSRGSKGRIYYDPDIQYQYKVNGTKYHSEKVSAFWIDGGETWADSIVAQFKTGETCKAYYDPDDPSQAVLLRKYYFQPYQEMLLGVFIFTTGLFIVLRMGSTKKYDPAPLGNGWFEVKPQFGGRQRLLIAGVCAVAWYVLGAVPAVHFFLCVPPPYSTTAMRDFGIFAALGLIPVGGVVRYWLMCRNLDEAQVRIDRAALHLGQPFNFAISQRVRRPSQAERFVFRVLCIATVGRGKSSTQTTIYEATPAELKDRSLQAGEDLELSGKFVLPANQYPSGRDGTGKYTWINWKIQLDCKLAGAPDYNVTFPIEAKVPFSDEVVSPEKQPAPGQLAEIQSVPSGYAGGIKAKSKLGIVLKLLPVFVQLLGIGILFSVQPVVFPGLFGNHQPMWNLPKPQAELVFGVAAVLVVVSSGVGLVFPGFLGGIYTFAVARKEVQRRIDAVVDPSADNLLVNIIPRSNWNRLNIKAEDMGFMAVDAERREIRFEGDKERYRIPAAAIASCTLEKSVFAPTAPPDAPGIWLVVLKIYTSSGTREVSFAPYLYKSRMSTKLRLQAAQKLQTEIESILPKAVRAT